MAAARNILVFPGNGSVSDVSKNKNVFANFMLKLNLADRYALVDVKGKDRIEIIDSVRVEKENAKDQNHWHVGSHTVLCKPTSDEVYVTAGNRQLPLNGNPIAVYTLSSYRDVEQAIDNSLNGIGHKPTDSSDRRIKLYHEIEVMALERFALAAVYDFAKHYELSNIRKIDTAISGTGKDATNIDRKLYDAIPYADKDGNRIYIFNLELTPFEGNVKSSGLLVMSNTKLGEHGIVEPAVDLLRGVFKGVICIWQSNQPQKMSQ